MFAIVTDDTSGDELARYELAGADMLECDIYARRFAQQWGVTIAPKTGHVPTGCADFTVTLQEEPGSVVCWNSESYFYGDEQ